MSVDAPTQATRLLALRRDAGLSQRDVAALIKKAGLSLTDARISAYEKDETIRIKMPILRQLARIYKTTPEYIETGRHSAPTIPINSGQPHPFQEDVYAEGFLLDLVPVDIPHLDPKARGGFIELGAGVSGRPLDLSHLDTVRLYVSSQEEAARYKNALVFTVDGDSMEPLMYTGQRVIGWQVPEAKWEQIHNKVCVVAYDDTVTIKAVRENELFTRGLLTLRAQNPDAGFLPVRREQISSIWQVEEFFDRPKVRL